MHRTGAGEPLVLLHGLGESHFGWRPVIDRLAADYDVIAIDLSGFGSSPEMPDSVAPTAGNLVVRCPRFSTSWVWTATTSPATPWAANLSAMSDLPTHLHTITAPTRFLQGTTDPLMSRRSAGARR